MQEVRIISVETDWWLQPGRRKFTVSFNDYIANHVKAIWRYVLKRSAERSNNRFKGALKLLRYDHLSHI